MFSKTETAAWQTITAPAELRHKVLSAAQSAELHQTVVHRKNIRYLSALAACLLLAISLTGYTLLGLGAPGITVEGKRLPSSGISLPIENGAARTLARTTTIPPVSIRIHTKGISDLIATHGTLQLFDSESGELLAIGQSVTAVGEIDLLWEIDLTDTAASPQLSFTQKGKTHTITLAFDTNEGTWYILRG